MARLYGPACEEGRCYCTVYRGVRLEDLFGGDGPYNPISAGDKLNLAERDEMVYSDTQATEETD